MICQIKLTLYMLGNFASFSSHHSADFFSNLHLKKNLEYHQSFKQF